jgi:hypothetical protein
VAGGLVVDEAVVGEPFHRPASGTAAAEGVAQQGLQVGLRRADCYRPDGRQEAHDLYLGQVSPR